MKHIKEAPKPEENSGAPEGVKFTGEKNYEAPKPDPWIKPEEAK